MKEWDGENLLGVVLEKVRVVIGPTDDSGVASLTPEAETSREQRSKERGLDSDVEAMELGDAFEAYEGPERLFPPGSGASSVVARLGSNDVLAAGYVPYGEGAAQDLTGRMDEARRERTDGRSSEREHPGGEGLALGMLNSRASGGAGAGSHYKKAVRTIPCGQRTR